MNKSIYILNKYSYMSLLQKPSDRNNNLSYDQSGGNKFYPMHGNNFEPMDDNKLKIVYKELTDNFYKIYDDVNVDKLQKGEIFNIMSVLGGYRSGMLLEHTNTFSLKYKNLNKSLLESIKKIIQKYKLNINIKKLIKTRNLDGTKNKHYRGHIIYDKSNESLAKIAGNDTIALGKLLDFSCEMADPMNDSLVQSIYAYDYPFFNQNCSKEGILEKQKNFKDDLKKFQKMGKILNVEVNMTVKNMVGYNTLLISLNKKGISGLLKYKNEIINELNFAGSWDDFKNVINILQSEDLKKIRKNEIALKSLITHAIIKYHSIPIDFLENFLLESNI